MRHTAADDAECLQDGGWALAAMQLCCWQPSWVSRTAPQASCADGRKQSRGVKQQVNILGASVTQHRWLPQWAQQDKTGKWQQEVPVCQHSRGLTWPFWVFCRLLQVHGLGHVSRFKAVSAGCAMAHVDGSLRQRRCFAAAGSTALTPHEPAPFARVTDHESRTRMSPESCLSDPFSVMQTSESTAWLM